MSIILDLSALEISAIKSWYEHVNEGSLHYDGVQMLLPLEQMLLKKIGAHLGGPISFTTSEIEIITGWMDRSIERRYGDSTNLFGYELRAYCKLKELVVTP